MVSLVKRFTHFVKGRVAVGSLQAPHWLDQAHSCTNTVGILMFSLVKILRV